MSDKLDWDVAIITRVVGGRLPMPVTPAAQGGRGGIPIRGEECGEGGLAVSDHAAAERPSSAMNSRRFNCSTSQPGRPEGHGRTPYPA